MNSDMMRAGQLLISGGFTCVLYRGGVSFTSMEKGLKPLLKWLDSGIDFSGFFAGDLVVGQSAAWLYTHLRVRGVYARVMTIEARDLLFAKGIAVVCDNYTERIMNREGTDFCPFEKVIQGVTDDEKALCLLRKKGHEIFGDWALEEEEPEPIPDPIGNSLNEVLQDLIGNASVQTLSADDLMALSETEETEEDKV